MIIDIRRAIESLVPNAKWDYSVPNEGGTEAQYNAIRWTDPRFKPSWADLVAKAETFAQQDLEQWRNNASVGPIQMVRALTELGMYDGVVAWVESTNDPIIQWSWNRATEFRRADEFIESARIGMSLTEEQVDDVFRLALTK